MEDIATASSLSEPEFASLVTTLGADPSSRHQLTELLREDHPLYDQRGAATTVRMRGWILHTLARAGVSDEALIFVLEELDTGNDPYLVAAAAKALRAYPKPSSSFAPFLMRAITNIRYRDDPVSFEDYGKYADDDTGTTPIHELLMTLEWLGPLARGVLPELESFLSQSGRLSRKVQIDVDHALKTIRAGNKGSEIEACCTLPDGLRDRPRSLRGSRESCSPIESIVFEDQDEELITFGEFFKGQPSIAVFFYTRCDNPLKCSLTITKLARIQHLLSERGLDDRINTAAITYDPEFDMPDRIRGYGKNRGVRTSPGHRMLRTCEGVEPIRKHFKLGVNFIESLVNRHRVELYILDEEGRVAEVFERIHWDEQQVVDCAEELLKAKSSKVLVASGKPESAVRERTTSLFGTLASLGVAFFPKCPICWAAYLSVFGIAGLDRIPYSPWLQPILATVMLINLGAVWLRARSTARMIAFYLVSAGAVAIIVSKFGEAWQSAALPGVLLTLIGSVLSALGPKKKRELVQH